MFKTERMEIRLMEEKDLENARNLHNEESTLNRLTDPFHVTYEEQVLWFKNISSSRKSRRYILTLLSSGAFIGVLRIDQIDLTNRSAVIGADVVPEARRQGLAYEAYEKMISYLFGNLGLARLQLETLVTNNEAIGLYKKLGFKIEGTLREAIKRNGKSIDLFVMGLLSSEWLSKK